MFFACSLQSDCRAGQHLSVGTISWISCVIVKSLDLFWVEIVSKRNQFELNMFCWKTVWKATAQLVAQELKARKFLFTAPYLSPWHKRPTRSWKPWIQKWITFTWSERSGHTLPHCLILWPHLPCLSLALFVQTFCDTLVAVVANMILHRTAEEVFTLNSSYMMAIFFGHQGWWPPLHWHTLPNLSCPRDATGLAGQSRLGQTRWQDRWGDGRVHRRHRGWHPSSHHPRLLDLQHRLTWFDSGDDPRITIIRKENVDPTHRTGLSDPIQEEEPYPPSYRDIDGSIRNQLAGGHSHRTTQTTHGKWRLKRWRPETSTSESRFWAWLLSFVCLSITIDICSFIDTAHIWPYNVTHILFTLVIEEFNR